MKQNDKADGAEIHGLKEAKRMPELKGELFSQDMVRAYLEGRKKHTARPIKPEVPNMPGTAFKRFGNGFAEFECNISGFLCDRKPKFQPGDFMYARETWQQLAPWDEKGRLDWDKAKYYYAADGDPKIGMTDDNGFPLDRFKWRPSIHMPREAARLFFRETKVEVMKLDDVTEEFAREDGFISEQYNDICYDSALTKFQRFWETTYGPDTRWMWVYWTEPCAKEEAMKWAKK